MLLQLEMFCKKLSYISTLITTQSLVLEDSGHVGHAEGCSGNV